MGREADGLRLRVVHLTSAVTFAGIERHVIALSRELRRLGCDAQIACLPAAVQLRAEARTNDVPLCPAGEQHPARWLPMLAREVITEPPDVLHVHDGRTAVAVALLRHAGGALVRTQHFARPASSTRNGLAGTTSLAVHRRVNRRFDGFIAVSRWVAEAAEARLEIAEGDATVIPPAVVIADQSAASRAEKQRSQLDNPVIAFAGRFEDERQLDVLLRALPAVRTRLPTCRVDLVGRGAAEGRLRRLAEELAVSGMISWHGWQAEPFAVMGHAHAYVNTWPWEGFGMAMAEAMALGMPVIAADSGASPEMVISGSTGMLFRPGDAIGLAEAIIKVLSDRDQAATMGRTARDHALALYGAPRTAELTLAFYRRLLEGADS